MPTPYPPVLGLRRLGRPIKQKRADVVGAEELYKRAGAIDPCHANSIYNYAVLLDSSLKQQEVRLLLRYPTHQNSGV